MDFWFFKELEPTDIFFVEKVTFSGISRLNKAKFANKSYMLPVYNKRLIVGK